MHKLVTIQNDVNDCGPAVIYSLVKYYKGYVSMEKIRMDTNLDKEGVSAYDMILTLKNYGFEAAGLKLEKKDLDVPYPLILHFDLQKYNHYVLLLRVRKGIYTIMDPSKGLVKLNSEVVDKLWTGVAIKAIPSGEIIKLDKSTSLFCLLKRISKQNKKVLFKILIIGLFLNVLGLLTNYYLQFLANVSHFWPIFLIFLGLTVAKLVLEYYFTNLNLDLNRNVDYTLQDSYLKHYLQLPLSILEKATSGKTLKHIEDLALIKEAIFELLIKGGFTLLQFSSGIILLLLLNKSLSGFLGIVFLVYIILKWLYNQKIRKKTNYLLEKNLDYQGDLVSVINGYKTIKDLHQENYFQTKLMQSLLDYLDFQKYYGKFLNKEHIKENFLLEISSILITSYGFFLTKIGKLTLINLFTFVTLENYLLVILKETMETCPKYYYLKQCYQRISEFGDSKEEEKTGLNFTNGNIKFSHVSFIYNNGHQVIKNLNHVIKKGQKVLLLGKSGTGKSTLCKLIYRYYPLKKGNITINDVNIQDINLDGLRDNIGYISQDSTLFNKTILDNIVGTYNVDTLKLNKVLKICCLENLIAKLPNRLNTTINEVNSLSGGEIQRIILARCLYQIKPILILDEALSQVDLETEKKIIRAIFIEYAACTLIYVTHKDVLDMFKEKISLS